MKKLEPAIARQRLAGLPHWRFNAAKGAITRKFVFADFSQAFAFMASIALAAEKRDHHPDWTNVYNKVKVTWSTHDAGGLTERDLEMARLCDVAFARFAPAA